MLGKTPRSAEFHAWITPTTVHSFQKSPNCMSCIFVALCCLLCTQTRGRFWILKLGFLRSHSCNISTCTYNTYLTREYTVGADLFAPPLKSYMYVYGYGVQPPVEISHRTSLSLIRWVVSILVTIVRYRYNHHRFTHSLLHITIACSKFLCFQRIQFFM